MSWPISIKRLPRRSRAERRRCSRPSRRGERGPMPLLLDAARFASAAALDRGNGITIGLVNNMPDTAWEATERQFLALVRAAAGNGRRNTPVRLKLFSITD